MPTVRQVTLKDVARHCGVSVMTVSWALRGERQHVSAETQQRVMTAATALGYDASRTHAARRLRYSGRARQEAPLNHLVAMTFSWEHVDSPYFVRTLKGLGEVLHHRGYALLTDWSISSEAALPAIFSRGEVDGVIVIEGRAQVPTVAALRANRGFGDRPIVGLFAPVAGCPNVYSDDHRGGLLLGRHLLARGHRRWLYTGIDGWAHEQRQEGYRDALREAGLAPGAHLQRFHADFTDVDAIARELRRALRARPAPTALLAGNDFLALKHAAACARLGLRIPADLALVGYDDSHVLPDGTGGNLLTTIGYSQEEAGRRAAALLMDAIEGVAAVPREVVLPVELIVRGSCACRPAAS